VGFSPIAPGRIRFPGPVNPARILGLALVDGALENLTGDVRRPRIDDPVCADSTALG
jgi:predicted N-acetyltransferase YhbS